jgi:23S rRNA (uracil1939-C5)-methyltransferase
MITHLLENLDLASTIRTVELYAGVGLFSAFLAPKVNHLTAVESSGSACHDFVINLDEFDNVDLYEAQAEEVLPTLDTQVDLLIMDPPRSGLAPAVHDALAKLQPKQIAYISCDPATLARDVKRIIGNGYHLQSITPFDLFPHTGHIEAVVLLSRLKEWGSE